MKSPFLLLLLLLSLLFSLLTALDKLTPDRPLLSDETLVSASGTFALGFFTPSSTSGKRYLGIWYNKVSVHTVVWVANRNNPVPQSANLTISPLGVLSIKAGSYKFIISTASLTKHPIAQILDTGNFVVKEDAADSSVDSSELFYAWQSFDYPTDTLLPGMKLGWDLTTGLNRNLTAWSSLTDPSSGPHTMAMDVRGDAQIFLRSGLTETWRTGPWNGVRFTGIPEMKTYSMFTFDFVQNEREVYYMFHTKDPSVVSRLIVNQTGVTQRLVWIEESTTWNVFWFAPKDQCDSVSPCGPFGLCNPNDSPICGCIRGFVPRNPGNWELRDGSDGCVRRTELDCRNGTDGFMTVTEAKLPDTSSSSIDMGMDLDQCRTKCLMNCSCTAYASADINGTGCLIWTTSLTDLRVWSFGGQDLYVRLAAADLGSTTIAQFHRRKELTVVILVIILLGLVLLAWFSCHCMRKKKRRRLEKLGASSFSNSYNYYYDSQNKDFDLPLFDFSKVIAATCNFSIENKLGEGGFGPVYKGILEDGQVVAIKMLAKTSVQGIEEFKNEMTLIAKLQHRNLVRLLGCCVQGEERMLIYEYMPNRSLDFFIFDKEMCGLLDWSARYSIILGIARGLLYLHQDSRLRIIHRDLKASNILLDTEMNPKISDFGMARIFGGDDPEVNTRKVVGTYGYMSPEYAMDGVYSVKSDVFSFGVLVLEIISGKKNRGVYLTNPDVNLLGYAWSLWKGRNGLELVDESMQYSYRIAEALRCIRVGLLCVQERPEDRPTMSSVLQMLGSDSASLPQPKQPGFVSTIGPLEFELSTSKQESSSADEISLSIYEGR